MSERHSTSEAVYHPIPQAPVASNTIPPSSPDLEVDEGFGPSVVHSHVAVDSRIRWIHFLLGCAVLLPWNGASTAPE
ncbi:hypothetical protein TRAPUB_10128 [Trametes pubescens]|uniref:Uncharacterized protein n=1 Tax=Trametes pubescens TaxID=154538 RepID=A0A1M2W0R9_TRAPU|nr:hypothetical protein TRAPUB_10128 [Trametes pubescens]